MVTDAAHDGWAASSARPEIAVVLNIYLGVLYIRGNEMALSIRNKEAERLAREVAREAGETITQAIRRSLEERLLRLSGRRAAGDLAE
jgi:hypothetical protein